MDVWAVSEGFLRRCWEHNGCTNQKPKQKASRNFVGAKSRSNTSRIRVYIGNPFVVHCSLLNPLKSYDYKSVAVSVLMDSGTWISSFAGPFVVFVVAADGSFPNPCNTYDSKTIAVSGHMESRALISTLAGLAPPVLVRGRLSSSLSLRTLAIVKSATSHPVYSPRRELPDARGCGVAVSLCGSLSLSQAFLPLPLSFSPLLMRPRALHRS